MKEYTLRIIETQEDLDATPVDFDGIILIDGNKSVTITVNDKYKHPIYVCNLSHVIANKNTEVKGYGYAHAEKSYLTPQLPFIVLCVKQTMASKIYQKNGKMSECLSL